MAVLWSRTSAGNEYKVTSAGKTVRLYRNSVLHSQWNFARPVSGHLWDLFILSSIDKNIARVLVLGAGGGSIIKLVQYFFPDARVDAIDLDKIHVFVAKKFFKVNSKNCIFYLDDASEWIKKTKQRNYDLIIDDVFFEGHGVPYRSVNAHASWIKKLLNKLSNKGSLVINFADQNEWITSKNQLQQFQYIEPYNVAIAQHSQCDNKIVHISKNPLSKKNLTKNMSSKPYNVFYKYFKKGIFHYRAISLKGM